MMDTSLSSSLRARALPNSGYGSLNWRGFLSLTFKEIRRFLKISGQTLVAPVIATLLFFAAFRLGVGGTGRVEGGGVEILVGSLSFIEFLIPGLVMMAIAQNAFYNTATNLILAKIQGHIVDLLLAPISPFECVLAHSLAGLVRGALVGLLTAAAIWGFSPWTFFDWGAVLYFGAMGAIMLSLLGLITGIWAEKFEQMATVQNLVIMPATFLSGTFFGIGDLPPLGRAISYGNPFFYMIDGFRYGFTGQADGKIEIGVAVMALGNLFLFGLAHHLVGRGRRLRG